MGFGGTRGGLGLVVCCLLVSPVMVGFFCVVLMFARAGGWWLVAALVLVDYCGVRFVGFRVCDSGFRGAGLLWFCWVWCGFGFLGFFGGLWRGFVIAFPE